MNKTNLSLLSFFCLTMILAGCNGKGGNSSAATPAVVSTAGKWSMTQTHVVSGDSTKITMDTTNDIPPGKNDLIIHQDGTYAQYNDGVNKDSGTYEIKDNMIVMVNPKYPEMPMEMDITTLSEHKMVLVLDKEMSGTRLQVTRSYTR
jgi:hypothetical protein